MKHTKFAIAVAVLVGLFVLAAPIELATAIGLAAAERAVKIVILRR